MRHFATLVPSLWRVLLITLSSQTDMPSLKTVTLSEEYAFKEKKTVHTKSSSFLLSLISRHHFRSPILSITSFFHIQPPCVSIPIITSITPFHLKQYTHSPLYFTNTHNCTRNESLAAIAPAHLINLQWQ